jgi:hypothetical protein
VSFSVRVKEFMQTLRNALGQSAETTAKRALSCFVEEQWDDFVLFAGISLEHAAKAKLVAENPAHIASGFASAHALTRAQRDVSLLPASVRTIGGADALDRAAVLDPRHERVLNRAKAVVDGRNAVAHLGATLDETSKRRLIVVFLRALNALLAVDEDTFWAPNHTLVKSLLDSALDENAKQVEIRIFRAKVFLADKSKGLTAEEAESLFAVTYSELAWDPDTYSEVMCPVCGYSALASGHIVLDVDVDFDDGIIVGGTPFLTYYASELVCAVCKLHLESPDELVVAGVPTSWDIDDDEALERYFEEPDEDMWRDR